MEVESVPLRSDHVGQRVTYVPVHAKSDPCHPDRESGEIVGWNQSFVFVSFGGNSRGCQPYDLVWG